MSVQECDVCGFLQMDQQQPFCARCQLRAAEAKVARFVAIVGRFRVKEGTATVMVDCDAHLDLIEAYLDARKERDRGAKP